MKALGIVRRIDDLGRVVIPKEVRRVLQLREGDPLEILISGDEVRLKKYSPVAELRDFAREYAESLYEATGLVVLIADHDSYIAVQPALQQVLLNRPVSDDIGQVMDDQESKLISRHQPVSLVGASDSSRCSFAAVAVAPIISAGDSVGAVLICSSNDSRVGDTELKLVETAAIFLGKQLEV